MKFTIAHANGDESRCIEMEMPEPVTLRQAFLASPLPALYPALDPDIHRMGIYGRLCPADSQIHEGDRVEIYLPIERNAAQADDDE
ncbi:MULTISPECIES: RnfH family protein [unclassified Brenneria]|uniref:RnfH family protein n=1 Tax=unclassified Brenneria TaxID=2634434 RepID=UPI001551885A|nr:MULTISPECIES: RnfH family protein [unclassified Brenneria]MBJ7220851.1 RnfH family protein [Brenneria sp. L3-3C-1]MEE3642090.1 RnfH family protein [Brenneria sp. L3_3C_1]MEE3649212.1 RnfH family protein [Brenneria sp. HEZEL_4_2_4]NPC99165.1 RnfH family protein [Brenneria sp. hezel4-2-4]